MAQARGRRSYTLIDFETTFGTDPASPNGILVPFNTNSIKASQNLTEDNTIRNRRDPAMPNRGNVDVTGDVVIPVDQIAIGYWLKAMFGNPVTTGTGLYTHKYTLGDTQPSMVIEKGFTDIGVYEKFNGCKVSRFSIEVGGDGELTATVGIMGAKHSLEDTAYDSSATELTLTKFNQFQASIKEGGTAIAIVTRCSLEIDFGLDGDQYVIGSQGTREDIPEGLAQASGSLTALFKDSTLLDKAIAGTETSLEISFTDGTNSLKFLLPEIMFERTSPTIDGPAGVRVELPFRNYYENATEGSSIVVELSNSHASYAD